MLRAKNIANLHLDMDDPWTELLASVAWAVCNTYQTTLDATPEQLIFNMDMIIPIKFAVEWDTMRKRKQEIIDKNNIRKNSTRIEHDFKVGNKILIKHTDLQHKLDSPMSGPFKIVEIHTNGTVSFQNGVVIERINIRRISPYWE